jgi:hypothetical protein
MKLPSKKVLLAGLVIVVTVANSTLFGLSWREFHSQSILASTANIKAAKETTVDANKQGQQFQEASYKFETLTASKINDPKESGNLVLATHKETKANFILALYGNTPLGDKINDGWELRQLTTDSMWLPGACSSKPNLLLQGKYIFIDDGKTKPTDKYSSYVLYNLQTNSYVYFGGDNLTEQQVVGERILAAVHENDQLVFYIDPTDKDGTLHNSPTFKHATGSDQQYIIRRVINPETLHYTDYKLPFTVPAGISYYYLARGFGEPIVQLISEGARETYDGKVASNRIELAKTPPAVALAYKPGSDETDLERHLTETLTKTLPELVKTNQPWTGTAYGTNFQLTELGSNSRANFLIVRYRYSGYQTPVVYDSVTNNIEPLISSATLSDSEYVPLGVF